MGKGRKGVLVGGLGGLGRRGVRCGWEKVAREWGKVAQEWEVGVGMGMGCTTQSGSSVPGSLIQQTSKSAIECIPMRWGGRMTTNSNF